MRRAEERFKRFGSHSDEPAGMGLAEFGKVLDRSSDFIKSKRNTIFKVAVEGDLN
jgi:hypothetical protein